MCRWTTLAGAALPSTKWCAWPGRRDLEGLKRVSAVVHILRSNSAVVHILQSNRRHMRILLAQVAQVLLRLVLVCIAVTCSKTLEKESWALG